MWLWGPVESSSQRGLVQETKGNQTRGPWKTANAVLTASLHWCVSDWQWYHASLIRFPHPFLCKFFNWLANIYMWQVYHPPLSSQLYAFVFWHGLFIPACLVQCTTLLSIPWETPLSIHVLLLFHYQCSSL